MNQLLLTCAVLAEGRADQFVKGFREGTLHRTANYDWLLFAVAGLAIAVAFYAFDRFYRHRPAPSHPNDRRLFQDICRAHGLDRGSTHLLQRLARSAKLAHVAEVFLRPDLFCSACAFSQRDRKRLEQLHRQLFAG